MKKMTLQKTVTVQRDGKPRKEVWKTSDPNDKVLQELIGRNTSVFVEVRDGDDIVSGTHKKAYEARSLLIQFNTNNNKKKVGGAA